MSTETSPSVLIASQDAPVAAALDEQCSRFGLTVSRAETPEALATALQGNDFDAIVLTDGFCPADMSGDDVLADCMAATNYSNGVVLLCGAERAAQARIPGVRTLTRPLRLGRFLTALATVLESTETHDQGGPRRIGPYMLYPSEKILRRREAQDTQNSDIRLTDKEVRILIYLHERAGRPVPREDLLQDVWQYSGAVMTRTLETHVYRLRQKIEDDPSSAVLLLTESGGYSLNAGDAV